jgi:tetratricopeptide (TPR) repeat protein
MAFTGRDGELRRITETVVGVGGIGRVVAIHAIGGMPGVGKTALAVHAAHLLRDRFPDRQLFIDLHAHTPGQDPATAQAALAGLLTADGVDPQYLPADLEGRAGLWRDRMAGQQALLVLDNAANSAQVTPLLPGGDGCLVLVTSRRYLGDLPAAVPLLLGSLPPEEARTMFVRLAPRAAADPDDAVAELTALAGYLPLAISLLARVYARHPSWALADLTTETRTSLLTLAAERDSVSAAFDVSWRHLDPGQQQFFRRLGLHPGTTIDAYAAAALVGTSLPVAAGYLDALHRESLLTEAVYRRYGMHDLIRRYIRDRAAHDPADDRSRALDRLLDYYQHAVATAEAGLGPRSRTNPGLAAIAQPAAIPDLGDAALALAWARAERDNLLACLDYATGTGQHARVIALTATIAALLRRDGPWTVALTRHTAAVLAAQQLGDRPGEANALSDLGDVRYLTGDYPEAAQALQEALGIYRGIGDRLGEASALTELGIVRRRTGEYAGAAQALEEALGASRGIGGPGEANALTELGTLRRLTGDYPAAAQALQEALGIYRGIGDRLGEASALSDLGNLRYLTGDYPGAAQAEKEALSIYRSLGNRPGEADALLYLGIVRRLTRDYPGAARAQEEALGIYRSLGDRYGEANALLQLGVIWRLTGDYPGAAKAQEEAIEISRGIGNRLGEAHALLYLGVVRRQAGDYPGATQDLEKALEMCRSVGERGGEVETLNELGTLQRVRGDLDQAGACHRQALDLARDIDSAWGEACALAGLSRCALAAGNTADARAGLRQAQEIFQRIDAAEAADVTAEIGAITHGETRT